MIIKGTDLNDRETKDAIFKEVKAVIEARYSPREITNGSFVIKFHVEEVNPYI